MNIQTALTTGNFNAGFHSEQARAVQETPAQQAQQQVQKKEEEQPAEQAKQQSRPRPQEEGKGLEIDITA